MDCISKTYTDILELGIDAGPVRLLTEVSTTSQHAMTTAVAGDSKWISLATLTTLPASNRETMVPVAELTQAPLIALIVSLVINIVTVGIIYLLRSHHAAGNHS